MPDGTEVTATTPAAAPVVAPAPQAAAPQAAAPETIGEPGWLKARIDRAAEAGEKKARKEAKIERRAIREAADEAKAIAASAKSEVEAAMRAVDAILADIPESDRNQLKAAAGGSAAKTLELFAAWKLAKGPVVKAEPVVAAPAPVAIVPATPTAVAPPATSAPAGNAPPPPVPGAPEDMRATYDQLRQSNPYLAAQFLINNQAEVFPDRKFYPDTRK